MNMLDEVYKRGWTKANGKVLTNLVMDGSAGGKLYVPINEYDKFLEVYANSLLKGEKNCLIELRTSPVFNWYADLDIMLTNEDTFDITQVCAYIQGAIKNILQKANTKMIILTNKTIKSNGVKYGAHLVCPFVKVQLEDCRRIRDEALESLVRIQIANQWHDAFDANVYRGGLRMLGARKVEMCKCKKRTPCSHCMGSGKCYMEGTYDVSHVLSDDGRSNEEERIKLLSNIFLRTKICSIRCLQRMPQQSEKPSSKNVTEKSDVLSAHLSRIHPSLRTFFPTYLRRVRGGVVLSCPDFKYCVNVEREHHSSNSYIFIGEDGFMLQRCHCPKYGCKDFASKKTPLPSEILRKYDLVSTGGVPLCFSR